MQRTLFREEHRIFREAFDKFLAQELTPYYERWEEEGCVDRALWNKAGAQGFLCPWVGEEYGGSGADFLYSVVMIESLARARGVGFSLGLHNDIVGPYLGRIANDEQKKRWLPGCVSGEKVLAIAMSEPAIGSNLAGMKTTAIRDGDHYIVNGQKTFITNGQVCDLLILAVKTDTHIKPAHKGLTLLVVEAGTPGFRKGIKLGKIGRKASDTSELWFEDCRVPVANRLGEEGDGFYHLMHNLQQERLVCAIGSMAEAEWCLETTLKYTKEREVFGKALSSYQNTQFKLAEIATEVEIGRTFLDRLIGEHMSGATVDMETSMAKWWITDMNFRTADRCLQLFGGYGYMTEYPISKAFVDFRVESIFAGSNEIMKTIIAKRLGL